MHVFLSASVPLPDRDRRFFESADVLAIREAIKALAEVVLPRGIIVYGGHPAITPLLALFIDQAGLPPERVTIYQSAYFLGGMPAENSRFLDVRIVPAVGGDRKASLLAMRQTMIQSFKYDAAVAVGGMDGVLEEIAMFTHEHPNAMLLPLASTGAAAAEIYSHGGYDADLATNMTYSSLFRRRLLPPPTSSKH